MLKRVPGGQVARTEIDPRRSWTTKISAALTPAEWWRLGSMLAVIVALHVIAWLTLVLLWSRHDSAWAAKHSASASG